jgi:hypothetical protein
MEVKIQFPEPVAEEVLRLPDRDSFVSRAVAQALELRRAPRTRQKMDSVDSSSGERRLQLPPLNDRRREDAWRRAHRNFLQERFAGHWVVLEGETIVAHSEDAAAAVEEARTKGVAAPFVFYVESPRPPGVVRLGL